MAQRSSRSPLERLTNHYNRTEIVCPACGFEDENRGWIGETNGANARYSRECPSCGAVQEHTVTFSR